MTTLWIVMGCMFMAVMGIRFFARATRLNRVETAALYILTIALIGINTAPARELIMRML